MRNMHAQHDNVHAHAMQIVLAVCRHAYIHNMSTHGIHNMPSYMRNVHVQQSKIKVHGLAHKGISLLYMFLEGL